MPASCLLKTIMPNYVYAYSRYLAMTPTYILKFDYYAKFFFLPFFAVYDFSRRDEGTVYIRYCGPCPIFDFNFLIRKPETFVYPVELMPISQLQKMVIASFDITLHHVLTHCNRVDPVVAEIIDYVAERLIALPLNKVVEIFKKYLGIEKLERPVRTLTLLRRKYKNIEAINVCSSSCSTVPAVPKPDSDSWKLFEALVDAEVLDTLLLLPEDEAAKIVQLVLAMRPELLSRFDDRDLVDSIVSNKEKLLKAYNLLSDHPRLKKSRTLFERWLEKVLKEKEKVGIEGTPESRQKEVHRKAMDVLGDKVSEVNKIIKQTKEAESAKNVLGADLPEEGQEEDHEKNSKRGPQEGES